MKTTLTIFTATLLLTVGSMAHAITIDGIFSVGEWDGKAVAVGATNAIPPTYELPNVYAFADTENLYMAFETVGAQTATSGSVLNAVMAMNIGADRPQTLSPTAALGENGKWSFAMENFSNTVDGVFSTGVSQYKYNDNDVDGAATGQTFGVNATTLGGQFSIAYDLSGDTQIIEYSIAIDALEAAFSRTYQDGVISAGDELKITGFFNRGGGFTPISYPDGGDFGPTFGDHAGYATLTVAAIPEPTTLALGGLGLALIGFGRRRRGA